MKCTVEEVRTDILTLSILAQKVFEGAKPDDQAGILWSAITRINWAASQYLEARKVLEFYADCYPQSGMKTKDDIFDDKGQRARDFLEGKE